MIRIGVWRIRTQIPQMSEFIIEIVSELYSAHFDFQNFCAGISDDSIIWNPCFFLDSGFLLLPRNKLSFDTSRRLSGRTGYPADDKKKLPGGLRLRSQSPADYKMFIFNGVMFIYNFR